jgi:hypothetical protein
MLNDLVGMATALSFEGGGGGAELHEKSVFFTLNMITTSETGIFEYDPQDEPPSGRPPGPWDGYNFFTVDLSTVKDNIEDMLARIAALEDELEDCHDCWEDVVAKLQEYDPDYDPDEGECPTEEIGKVVDEKEQEIEALEEQIEECDQCKADVIAKLQEYDLDFDPQTCSDIPPEIDKIAGYNIPIGIDPTDPVYFPIIGAGEVTDDDINASISMGCRVPNGQGGWDWLPITKQTYDDGYRYFIPTAKVVYTRNGEQITDYRTVGMQGGLLASGWYGEILNYSVATGGIVTVSYVYHTTSTVYDSGSFTVPELDGYGNTSHSYKVKNS